MITSLHPPALKKGDTVAIIAPAGQLTHGKLFEKGVEILQGMGFKILFPENLWPGTSYLADTDANRAQEFNFFLQHPQIKCLISLRGGYGCLRMIGQIDLKQVLQTPKIVVGFSDLTVLQNYLYQKTGLITLHGPVVTSLATSTEHALERYFHCLCGDWSGEIDIHQVKVLKNGHAVTAPLIGGNLASMMTLLGTKYDCKWDGKIVFLEDINEPLYKIDRMLTQLNLAGKLTNLSGLILGNFSFDFHTDKNEQLCYQESVWQRVLEICCNYDFPIWGNFPAGHCSQNLTLPLGSTAEMRSEETRLVFT